VFIAVHRGTLLTAGLLPPPGPGGGSTHAAQMLDRSGFFDV
jgi:hypothetical protein